MDDQPMAEASASLRRRKQRPEVSDAFINSSPDDNSLEEKGDYTEHLKVDDILSSIRLPLIDLLENVIEDEDEDEDEDDVLQTPRRLYGRRPRIIYCSGQDYVSEFQGASASASIQVSERFVDLASAFNWGALMLVLGSYGLMLANPLFWMCWSILVVKAVSCWEWLEAFRGSSYELEGTTMPRTAGAIVLKLKMSIALIFFLVYSHDITERQNTMLLIIAASVILFEGVMPISIRREELILRSNPWGNNTGGQKLKALIFLILSTLNAMINMTGLIVVGGDLGRLMRKQAFWGFTFIFLVDALAEVFPRIVNGRNFRFVILEDLPKTHHVVVMLRTIVEGFLCWWMGKVIHEDSYFPSHLGIDNCNKLCQERSKHLLITMVALGGLQVAGTFTDYSLYCLFSHRHNPCPPIASP